MKKLFVYFALIAVVLLLFTLTINAPWFDEDLLPEVQAIKNAQAEPYVAKNAYPALLAINGDRSDFNQASQEIRQLLNKNIRQSGRDFLNATEYDLYHNKTADESWQNDYPTCNSRRDRGCMADLLEQIKNQPITNQRLKSQLDKYHALIQLQHFNESTQVDLNAPLVSFGPIIALKRLYLANSFATDSTDEFIRNFNQDMRFWRMLLADGHHMITKMVAVATLHNSIDALSKAIDDEVFTDQQLMKLHAALPRLSPAEADMQKVFDFEFKHSISFYEAAEQQGDSRVLKLFDFFQPHATQNLAYRVSLKPLRDMAVLSADGFYAKSNSGEWHDHPENQFSWSPTSLYNPVGKILVGTAMPAYSDYVARIHDLEGMLALLKLKMEVKLSPDKPVAAIIETSEQVNPYTGEPMSYDAAKQKIHFSCVDKTANVCEISL